MLRPRSRKLCLTLHVGFSVAWLGAAMMMLVLAIVIPLVLLSFEPSTIRS